MTSSKSISINEIDVSIFNVYNAIKFSFYYALILLSDNVIMKSSKSIPIYIYLYNIYVLIYKYVMLCW